MAGLPNLVGTVIEVESALNGGSLLIDECPSFRRMASKGNVASAYQTAPALLAASSRSRISSHCKCSPKHIATQNLGRLVN